MRNLIIFSGIILLSSFNYVHAQEKRMKAEVQAWLPAEFNLQEMLTIWQLSIYKHSQKNAEEYLEKNYKGKYVLFNPLRKTGDGGLPKINSRFELRFKSEPQVSMVTNRTVANPIIYYFYDNKEKKEYPNIPAGHGTPGKAMEDIVDFLNEHFAAK